MSHMNENKKEVRAEARGLTGVGPAPMPADTPAPGATTPPTAPGEIGGRVFRYVKGWRWTGMGAITWYIAVCPTCCRVVKRISTRRSRAGTHGEDYFKHEHPLLFVGLYESNSGNRHYRVDEELLSAFPWLKEVLEDMWIYERAHPEEVAKVVDGFLRNVKR